MNSILKNKKTIAAILAVIFLIAVAFIIKNAFDRHEYTAYDVTNEYAGAGMTLTTTEATESGTGTAAPSGANVDTSSKYLYVDGQILRYSGDGAALLDEKFQTIWDETFSMTNPQAEAAGTEILIYDQLGSSVSIYNDKGKVGSFDTGKPILKAKISREDTVAVLAQNGENTSFAYYKADGSVIAAGGAAIDSPGYPVDLSISPNAEDVAVSYLTVSGGTSGSRVEFYTFGADGSSKTNNLKGSLTFPRSLVPVIDFVSDGRAIAVFDTGFTVVNVGETPKVSKTVTFSKDIVSTFHDADNIGFIFSGNSENPYSLSLYTTKGNYLTNTDISVRYTDAAVYDDQIVLWNTSGFAAYSMKGFCRFNGKIDEGTVRQVLRVGGRQYMVLTDEKLEMIQLK